MTANNFPTPWRHRKSGPILNIDGLYYRTEDNRRDGFVIEICSGERYAHIAPGLLFNHETYRGSYINNWHGGPTGSLTEMIKWLQQAEHPEYGYSLWMKED
jgi:hypothetical protein